jgi:hypothetical protein
MKCDERIGFEVSILAVANAVDMIPAVSGADGTDPVDSVPVTGTEGVVTGDGVPTVICPG